MESPHSSKELLQKSLDYDKEALSRLEAFIASDEPKSWLSTYSHLQTLALDVALQHWFVGDQHQVAHLLRISLAAATALFGAEPGNTRVTTPDGRIVEEQKDTSLQSTHSYLIAAQLAFIVGDADSLKKLGEINHLIHFASLTMYRLPERYEEARVLQEICLGKKTDARERLKSWNGKQTLTELKDLGVGTRKRLVGGAEPKLEPWTGRKTPFILCIEAVLNSDDQLFEKHIQEELKDHQKFRKQRYHSLIQEEVCLPALAGVLFAKRDGMNVSIKNKYLPAGLVQLLLSNH